MKLRLPIAFAFAAVLAVSAPAFEIERVWTAHRDHASFVRLGEYFHGQEKTGRMVLLRSQPESRDGLYFTIRVNAPKGVEFPAGEVRLHVIAPDGVEPKTYTFPFAAPGRRSVRFEVGLTGADWEYAPQFLPLAWKLEIVDQAGQPLASRQSFLWERPPEAPPKN